MNIAEKDLSADQNQEDRAQSIRDALRDATVGLRRAQSSRSPR